MKNWEILDTQTVGLKNTDNLCQYFSWLFAYLQYKKSSFYRLDYLGNSYYVEVASMNSFSSPFMKFIYCGHIIITLLILMHILNAGILDARDSQSNFHIGFRNMIVYMIIS